LHIAYQQYEKALAIASEMGDKTRAAETYVALATIAYANQDTELAKRLLFQAVADPVLCPRALFVMCALGLLQDDAVLATSALVEFPKLQAEGLSSVDSCLRDQNILTSALLQLQGHIKFARNALLKAVHMYPNSSTIWIELAAFLNQFVATMEVKPADSNATSSVAAHCATAAWAVRSQEGENAAGSSRSALALAAVGHLIAGTGSALIEARSAAMKAVHEAPDSANAWSALAAASFVHGVRSNDANEISMSITATRRCMAAITEERAGPQTVRNAARLASLTTLEHWVDAFLCDAHLALANCTRGSTDAGLPEGTREASLSTVITLCTEATAKYQGDLIKLAPFYALFARAKVCAGSGKEGFATAVQSLKVTTASADAWQMVAGILVHKGLFAEAEACFRQSLSVTVVGSMQRVAVLLRLSLAALRAGNLAVGKEAASEAVRSAGDMPAVRLILGLAKQAGGDSKGAKKEFGKAGEDLASYADALA
jgi:tetratricopeptide (TPR) repeat protein